MKKSLNLIVVLSLILFALGCSQLNDSSNNSMNDFSESDSEIVDEQSIDVDSDDGDYIEKTEKGITYYKGVPYTGILLEYHENGQLLQKSKFIEGKLNGSSEMYYENGQLLGRETYKNGILNGSSEMYYKNGQLLIKGNFVDGKPNDLVEMYQENGQLSAIGTYKNGKLNGSSEMYYENGQILYKGIYEDGKLNGLSVIYYENGQLQLKGNFKNGELIGSAEKYTENGQLEHNATFKFPESDLMSGFMVAPLEEQERRVQFDEPSLGVYKSGNEVINFKSFRSIDIGIADSLGCNLDVMTQDLGEMSWKDAQEYCKNLQGGWRLPNLTELYILNKYRDEIGGFSSEVYWSDMDNDIGQVMVLDFGEFDYDPTIVVGKETSCYVRIVRGEYTKSSPPPPPPSPPTP